MIAALREIAHSTPSYSELTGDPCQGAVAQLAVRTVRAYGARWYKLCHRAGRAGTSYAIEGGGGAAWQRANREQNLRSKRALLLRSDPSEKRMI